MESQVVIARAGSKLGTFSPEQVKDGLRSGLFRPSDHYWQTGSKTWETLATLHPGLGSNPRPAAPPAPKAEPSPQGFGGCLLKVLSATAILAVLLVGAAAVYELGNNPRGKRAEAEKHFRQAAGICKSLDRDSGLLLALLLSGGAFLAGDPEIAELQRAMPHLRAAAEKGHRQAQCLVGLVLKLDPGNKAEAEAFLLRAAKQGHPLASRVLSEEYALRHPIHTNTRQRLEDGLTWHFITPEKLRNPHLAAAIGDGTHGGPTVVAAKRRAAEFRPISE